MSTTSRPHTTLVSVTHDDAAHLPDFVEVVTRQGLTPDELQVVMVDIGSSATGAHLLVVGVALLALVLFARTGLLGALRAAVPWLP